MKKLILMVFILFSPMVLAATDTNANTAPDTSMSTTTTDTTTASPANNNAKPKATDMHSKWICTTNASSSQVAQEKAADDKMASQQGKAKEVFSFAAKNCRDCTKITCEKQ